MRNLKVHYKDRFFLLSDICSVWVVHAFGDNDPKTKTGFFLRGWGVLFEKLCQTFGFLHTQSAHTHTQHATHTRNTHAQHTHATRTRNTHTLRAHAHNAHAHTHTRTSSFVGSVRGSWFGSLVRGSQQSAPTRNKVNYKNTQSTR